MSELKEYIKTARIYYKVAGSDKMHVITPLTYNFLKGEIYSFENSGLEYRTNIHTYIIKDNISYIHFYKILRNYGNRIKTGSNTKLEVTIDNNEQYCNFEFHAKDLTIKREDESGVIFSAEIKDTSFVKYKDGDRFEIYRALKTVIYGNINTPMVSISSTILEMSNLDKDIYSMSLDNKVLSLNNISCKIFKFYINSIYFFIQNSNIESFCVKLGEFEPFLINSIWRVNLNLTYGFINKENVIITDETSYTKMDLDLNLEYDVEREFLNGVKNYDDFDAEPIIEMIEERAKSLKLKK